MSVQAILTDHAGCGRRRDTPEFWQPVEYTLRIVWRRGIVTMTRKLMATNVRT